ncbi:ATP-binding protein [Sphaerothrix gracilis]|uniref:ATP-binding protein n=1 Tax=Sphaerothrix gracilis TaxID=3151835 RepID=UPI0031FC14AE
MTLFKKATKQQARLRLAICGASGTGKTYTALNVGQFLGANIALLDTEHGSASKYADRFNFDVCELTDFSPSSYIMALREAANADYDLIIIDSLTHAWYWELDAANSGKNSFTGWKEVRKLERALVDEMLSYPGHLIATMRTKTEWILEENERGKQAPRRVGTAPIQASGIEYEFDLAGELDYHHILTISKSRCSELANTEHLNPGENLADRLLAWLDSGEPAEESPQNKARRVMVAREAAGLTTNDVRRILEAEFDGVSTPAKLTSQEVDRLVLILSEFVTDPRPDPAMDG